MLKNIVKKLSIYCMNEFLTFTAKKFRSGHDHVTLENPEFGEPQSRKKVIFDKFRK